ncbi:MAG: zinc ribbon domain-containing protein [Clostridia bacterium]|nr:zinc ribbon domain-containing protein [Clostridia bacterium]
MKCKNCGATLDEGALFCRRCGTSVPKVPEPEPKQKAKKTVFSGIWDRVSGWFGRVGKWFSGTYAMIRNRLAGLKTAKPAQKRRFLLLAGTFAALLVILIVVIACAVSCKKPVKYETPEKLTEAVIETLEKGDGEALYSMAGLSHKVLGEHTELFGAGDTPETVMQGYYERLAGDLYAELTAEYGEGYRLEGQTETTVVTDTTIFEANRALNLEAEKYAEITGPLYVGDAFVKNLRIVAVELDGAWKLLAVYLY